MKISINDILIDNDIYPRTRKSQQTIDQYVEALRAGAQFPSIECQRISIDGTEQIIILDGLHRWEAYKKAQPELGENSDFSQIEAHFWKDEVLDKKENLNLLRLRSAALNSQHGDRMTNADYQSLAEKIARDDPDHKLSSETIAKEWGLRPRTVRDWVQSIRAKQKAKRDRIIFKLSMLGWSTREIAEVVGIDYSNISRVLQNGEIAKMQQAISDWLSQGKTVEEAAEKLEIDATLAWAIHLCGKSDIERLADLGVSLKLYDDWSFQGCDARLGISYPGRIPGQLVINTLYYYTVPGDLVIDPMAGGGTVVDACLLMGRKCYAYDIEPVRKDIKKHNIEASLPPGSDECNLMFIDPPYWSMLDEQYSDESVSSKTLDDFNKWLEKLASDCYVTLKPGAKLAFLIQNQTEKNIPEGKYYLDHVFTAQKNFVDAGFKMVRRINCPLSTETFTPQREAKMKGIKITERSEIEGIALARYYPKRLKRLHYWDEFSRDLYQFKKYYDVALIEKLAKGLAEVLRATGRTFDIATHPPPSRARLYYPCSHLAQIVSTELDLDLLDCLRWAGGKGESQKKRVGRMKLARLYEAVECTSDLSGLDILLLDDICTTGITLSKCQEALKFAGAESCFSAVLGWTVSEDKSGFKRAF